MKVAHRVYQTYYEEHQLSDKTASDIAWIGSIQIFFQYVTSLISGSLFDLYGAKVRSSDRNQLGVLADRLPPDIVNPRVNLLCFFHLYD